MSTERPKRSTRAPARFTEPTPERPNNKRKAPAIPKTAPTPVDKTSLEFILTNPKSPLVSINMSSLINQDTWVCLSDESRAKLAKLLPPTAFPSFEPSLPEHHPSRSVVENDDAMQVEHAMGEPNLSFLTCPFFDSAARTFQDHLYSGWFTEAHKEKVAKFDQGVANGTLHAAWKDQAWEEEQSEDEQIIVTPTSPVRKDLAGEAAGLKLTDLAKHGALRVGDILAYKRRFINNLVIEKDCLIEAIESKTGAITIVAPSGTAISLPPTLLGEHPTESPANVQSMVITIPSQLETAVLDMDGRLEKAKRPNGNAWKTFTLYRWREEVSEDILLSGGTSLLERGGRENHGTLFYLRGSFWDNR